MSAYAEEYRRSLDDRDRFWLEAADAIEWTRPPTRALDDSTPPLYRWFPDGELNTAANALDRHVRDGRGDRPPRGRQGSPTSTHRCSCSTPQTFASHVAPR